MVHCWVIVERWQDNFSIFHNFEEGRRQSAGTETYWTLRVCHSKKECRNDRLIRSISSLKCLETKTFWQRLSYRREDEDRGGASGDAFVVVALYLGYVVAKVPAVVHPTVAAKYNWTQLFPGSLQQRWNCLESSPKILNGQARTESGVSLNKRFCHKFFSSTGRWAVKQQGEISKK